MRFACAKFGHNIDIQRLNDFFARTHEVIGFQRLDEERGGGRLNGSVKVDSDIYAGSLAVA